MTIFKIILKCWLII